MNVFERWAISMLLCFTAGAALAHSYHQPMHNAIDALEAQIQFLLEKRVVGFLVWDDKQCAWQYVKRLR